MLFDPPGRRRRPPITLVRREESAPTLIFKSNVDGHVEPEPPEVAAFKEVMTTDPIGLVDALHTLRGRETNVEDTRENIERYGRVLTNIVLSPHWEAKRLAVDGSTEERYLQDPTVKSRLRAIGSGAIQAGSAEHAGAKLELRIALLSTLAMRTLAADPTNGVIYFDPIAARGA